MTLPTNVRFVLTTLNNAGFQAFVVGGAVRDIVLGIEPQDFDVTTDALPDALEVLFDAPGRVNRFGTVDVLGVEVTTMRADHQYGDHRRPDSVTFTTDLTTDLSRRDFTINAMARDIDGHIFDPFNGQTDLRQRILRTVGDADDRFNEDALRMLRAIRFAARFEMILDGDILVSMFHRHNEVNFVSAERRGVELMKMLTLPQRNTAILFLRATQLLGELLPGASTNRSFEASESVRSVLADLLRNVEPTEVRRIITRLALGRDLANDVAHLAESRAMERSVDANDPVALRRFMAFVGRDFLSEVVTSQHLADAIAEQGDVPLTIGELAVDGHDVMRAGLRGRQIGIALSALLEAVIRDPLLNTHDQLMALVEVSLLPR